MITSKPTASVAILFGVLLLPYAGRAADCTPLLKELRQLRIEYRRYATGAVPYSGIVEFERLAAMLDEIIELKRKVGRANCPGSVPSRLEDLGEKPREPKTAPLTKKSREKQHERRRRPKSR